MIPAVVTHCAGIDIGKRVLAVCLMVGPADAEPKVEVREFSTFTADLEAMKEWLKQAGCTHVVMESTGPYWKPVFNVLEGRLRQLSLGGRVFRMISVHYRWLPDDGAIRNGT